MQEIDQKREQVRDFIQRCITASGAGNATKLAKLAGMSHTTITRFLNDPDFKNIPKADTLARIGNVAGLEVPRGILIAVSGLSESGDAYTPEDRLSPQERQAATALYPEGDAATMIVKSRAMALEGYLPGDRILVDLASKPQPGDHVVVTIGDEQSGSGESYIRVLESHALLVPRAAEPGHRTLRREDEQTVVMGVIVSRYKLPKASAA